MLCDIKIILMVSQKVPTPEIVMLVHKTFINLWFGSQRPTVYEDLFGQVSQIQVEIPYIHRC